MKYPILIALILLFLAVDSKLIFSDEFDTFDFKKWKHDITLSGGGNWEFELYENNRSTSFVKNSKLNIKPVLTENKIGMNNVRNGFTYDVWGATPNQCTGNGFYGCSRTSDGVHYINPVMSAKLTTVQSFAFKYGRIEIKAKLPKGNWLWPAIWLLPRYE
jgi:beta-glucanase (GH16 family)